MRGLAYEYLRFAQTCMADATKEEIESTMLIFMAGACAATDRFLSILDSGLPVKRKNALIRRMAREMEQFQTEVKQLSEQQEGAVK